MKEQLMNYFAANTGALTLEDMVLNFLVAVVLGAVIYLSYRISHSGAAYSARFNVSLLMLTLVTTLVMNVIGNNIALSLGMVGALSIVRFRTAIKDPRDTAYIFWGNRGWNLLRRHGVCDGGRRDGCHISCARAVRRCEE